MKKYLFLMAMVILLSGCGKSSSLPESLPPEESASVSVETTAPTTQPSCQTESAVILADHVPAVLSIVSRGDVVDVVDEYDQNHYVIKTNIGYGLIEKNYLRIATEAPYEAWTGYSQWNKSIFSSSRLNGTPIQTLSLNDNVEVIDDLGISYVVKVGNVTGFMNPKDISKSPIRQQSGNSPSGGAASGGGASSGGSSSGDGGGVDGGDISLQVNGGIMLLSAIKQEGAVTGQAVVKADGTEVVLGYFDMGDMVDVIVGSAVDSKWEGFEPVLLENLVAYIPSFLLRMTNSEPYAAWDGFAKPQTEAFDNFYLCGTPKKVPTNTAVRVVADLNTCYLVSIDSDFAYVNKTSISEQPVVIHKPQQDTNGSGSSGSPSSSGQEWSDPVL